MGSFDYLIITVCAGIVPGRVLRTLWRLKGSSFLDRTVLDLSLGLGLLSLIFFVMGATQLLISTVPLLILAMIGIIGVWLILSDVVITIAHWLKKKRFPCAATIIWTILFLCLAFIVLIPALAPPSGSDWDSLAYHLAIPKLYLQHGGFYYIDYSSHSNFPFLVEMLYTPALSMNNPAGAKMVHYLYGVLLVLAVVMLTRKHFNPKAAPLAALAVASMPIVLWEATTAYIDLATALYTVIAVNFLLNYLDNEDRKSLVGCAIAVGFAASTKMTALALIPLLIIWLLIDRYAAVRRIEWKRALMFVGIALLVCSPWYIKTLIYTGNPVYPFFYSIFGGKDWTSELAQNYTMLQGRFGMGHNLGSFLMLPWNLTFHSDRFYDTPGLFIGPIFLVAVPLLLVTRYNSRKLVGLTLFFLAQIILWFVLTQQSRYLIPSFAILAVIITAIAYFDERCRFTRTALYLTFIATMLFGILRLSFQIIDAAPVVFGHETQDAYLSKTLPIYPAQKWINEHTPSEAKIALFGDTRGYYLDRDYVWADPGHNVRFTRNFASVSEFVAYMKEQGITYALVNYQVFPAPAGATGTSALVYKAIDEGRFEEVHMAEWTGDIEPVIVDVYKIR